jgi:branched-chain amino acid transport system ATP-binding protein
MSQAILQVRDISLSFKGVKAINALSFEVQRGEICALIGPNGAGKSSLLNVLNGVYRFDAGEIVFEAQHFHRIDPLGAARRGISRTFQNNALFKKMSVLDNLLTGLSRHMRTSFIEQALGSP